MKRLLACLLLTVAALVPPVSAHVENRPSVHDTVAGVVERMRGTLDAEQLASLNLGSVLDFLTPEEREALGEHYLTFHVNVPVVVSVVRDAGLGEEPYWLRERGFAPSDGRVQAGTVAFDVWSKAFDAGHVGLGCNSLSGGGRHYFVAIRPQQPGDAVAVTDIYPGAHTVGTLGMGAVPFVDRADTVSALPGDLDGQTLLRGVDGRRRETQLLNVFQTTPYPATEHPDQVVLTWSGDPATTQTIQWRTSVAVARGGVAYMKKADRESFTPGLPTVAAARTERLETPFNVNDPVNHRHTVALTGLEPDTVYVYGVGCLDTQTFPHTAEFKTAPNGAQPFSFIYMGDAQNGLERWESVVQRAYRDRPDAAFYVMAGDIVNRGNERHEWDILFHSARGIFDRRPLAPALGNHEYQGGEPELYLRLFALPEDGPEGIAPKKAYAFRYSNALFVVLDSNQPAETQTAWLEEQLAGTDATWKFVVYHHPAYSSSPRRDNPEIRSLWGALFDKYHVDMALQGHDHAYLRTYPMRGGARVGSPAEGTIYVVSVSGTKFYDMGEFDYTEKGMANTATFQVLDIQVRGDRLVYRAYDVDGNLHDEFVIEK